MPGPSDGAHPVHWDRGTFYAVDLLALLAACLCGAAGLAFDARPAAAAGGACGAAVTCAALWHRAADGRVSRFVHDWVFAPVAYLLYLGVSALNIAVTAGDTRDAWLIAADRWLFGGDPTRWLAGFTHPVLTELLQLAYTGFYPLLLGVGGVLYRHADRPAFRRYTLTLALGFGVSFVGYLLVPAVGPRFALHTFEALSTQLPGLWLTQGLRTFVDVGGLAWGTVNPDAFPSGHTLLTVVAVGFGWRHAPRQRWLVAGWGTLVVVATVYLRYHYVVDILAAGVLAAGCLAISRPLHRWLSLHGRTRDEQPRTT